MFIDLICSYDVYLYVFMFIITSVIAYFLLSQKSSNDKEVDYLWQHIAELEDRINTIEHNSSFNINAKDKEEKKNNNNK